MNAMEKVNNAVVRVITRAKNVKNVQMAILIIRLAIVKNYKLL